MLSTTGGLSRSDGGASGGELHKKLGRAHSLRLRAARRIQNPLQIGPRRNLRALRNRLGKHRAFSAACSFVGLSAAWPPATSRHCCTPSKATKRKTMYVLGYRGAFLFGFRANRGFGPDWEPKQPIRFGLGGFPARNRDRRRYRPVVGLSAGFSGDTGRARWFLVSAGPITGGEGEPGVYRRKLCLPVPPPLKGRTQRNADAAGVCPTCPTCPTFLR